MSTKIASLFVEIGANIDGLMKGLSKARDETNSTAAKLNGLTNAALKVGGAAAAVGVVFKAAFDLGQQGASITQVQSSFENLLGTLGAAPTTLGQMQDATRNTVSEFDLMSSSTTFLKGATGEMGQAFAAALPQLAGIAQAAHDLNPTMGTTAEMFDRLTRGVRKAEPELLDEMGIIFRLDNVYRDYAATIGKTAEQLTVEEKSMATLNAVLAQGAALTQQAAGVNVGASDSFARLSASIQDSANSAKSALAPALANAADATYGLLYGTRDVNSALETHAGQVAATSQTYDQYVAELQRAADVAGYTVNANGDLVQSYQDMGYTVETVVQSNYLLSASEWAAAKSAQGMANAADQLGGGLSTLDSKAQGFSNSIADMGGGLSRLGQEALPNLTAELQANTTEVGASDEAWAAYGERMTAAAEATGQTAITMDQLQIMTVGLAAGLQGTLGDAIGQYTAGLTQLQAQQAQIQTQMDDLAARGIPETSAQYQQLTEAMNQNQLAQQQALAATQQLTAEFIYNQAAVGLDTQAALDLARSMGVLSEADYGVATSVQTLRQEFDANRDGMISASEGAARYAAGVDMINRAAANLIAKGITPTVDAINKELSEMAVTDAAGALQSTAGAAGESAETMGDLAENATPAAEGTGDVGSAAEEAAGALKLLMGAGSSAKAGLDTVRKSAEPARDAMAGAAGAAEDLADAMRQIPRGVSVSATATGFSEAIGWVENLTDALNNIPTSISASIHLSTGGGGGGGGGTGGGAPKGPEPAAPTASAAPMMAAPTTINVYNPLAMAMYMAQQKAATQAQFDEAMK